MGARFEKGVVMEDLVIDTNLVSERRKKRFSILKADHPIIWYAQEIGISRAVLYEFMNGEYNMSSYTLWKLSKVTGRSIEWLLAFEDDDDTELSVKFSENVNERRTAMAKVDNHDSLKVVFKTEDGIELCKKAQLLVNSDIKKVIEYVDYLIFTHKNS